MFAPAGTLPDHLTNRVEASMPRTSPTPHRRRRATAWPWRVAGKASREILRFAAAAALAFVAALFGAAFSTRTATAQDSADYTRQSLGTLQQQVADLSTWYESQPSNETRCDLFPAGPYNKRAWYCTTAPPTEPGPRQSRVS